MKKERGVVVAWVVAYRENTASLYNSIAPGERWVSAYETRASAIAARQSWREGEDAFASPVVRIEIPEPR